SCDLLRTWKRVVWHRALSGSGTVIRQRLRAAAEISYRADPLRFGHAGRLEGVTASGPHAARIRLPLPGNGPAMGDQGAPAQQPGRLLERRRERVDPRAQAIEGESGGPGRRDHPYRRLAQGEEGRAVAADLGRAPPLDGVGYEDVVNERALIVGVHGGKHREIVQVCAVELLGAPLRKRVQGDTGEGHQQLRNGAWTRR